MASGVKVAYLSGIEGEKSDESNFDKNDVESLRNSCLVTKATMSDYRGVDILVTSQWPKGIQEDKPGFPSSSLISWLSTQIRPRYHFCGLTGIHYEHLPFRTEANDNTQLLLSTRFVSLAHAGNKEKLKSVYALSLAPVEKMRMIDLIQKTTDEVESPYNAINFSNFKLKGQSAQSNQYFYDINSFGGEEGRKRGNRNQFHNGQQKRPRPQSIDQEKCWFCLSSANVEKHLVISIGENFYLALAKGPLNDYHVLILSVTHIQSVSLLSKDDFDELERFKEAIRQFFKTKIQAAVFFERNYKSSHLQVNAVAVSEAVEWAVKSTVEDKAEEFGLQFEVMPKLTEPTQLPPQGPYFAIELPDNTTHITRQMKNFPLHFGRDILCAEPLLNCEHKVDWKECGLDKDAEVELVKKFRAGFKEFDFTL